MSFTDRLSRRSGYRRRYCRATAALIVALVASLVVGACGSGANGGNGQAGKASGGSDWNSVVAQAKKEGHVTLYASISADLLPGLAKAFEKKYGIKVKLIPMSTVPLIQRMLNDQRARKWDADVVQFSDPRAIDQFLKQGIINSKPDIPSASLWPKKYYNNGIGSMKLAVETIGYNTKVIPPSEAPKSWTDALDPRWKGKMGILEPAYGNIAQPWQWLDSKYGDDYIKKIRAQKPKFYTSGNEMLEAVVSGELQIAVVAHANGIYALQKKGAPIAAPKMDTLTGWDNPVWAASKAPHPAAARLLLNFILSKEGQLATNGNNTGESALNVKGTLPMPPHYEIAPPSDTYKNLNRIRGMLGLAPVNT